MGKLRTFTHLAILATTPSFLIYPQEQFLQTSFSTQKLHLKEEKTNKTDFFPMMKSFSSSMSLSQESLKKKPPLKNCIKLIASSLI
jgi:hypothetical protein